MGGVSGLGEELGAEDEVALGLDGGFGIKTVAAAVGTKLPASPKPLPSL